MEREHSQLQLLVLLNLEGKKREVWPLAEPYEERMAKWLQAYNMFKWLSFEWLVSKCYKFVYIIFQCYLLSFNNCLNLLFTGC